MIRRAYIPPTTAGVRVTLALMKQQARIGATTPAVAEMAHVLYESSGGARFLAPRIRGWLESHWREVPDPYGVELLRTPLEELTQYHTTTRMSGDCDDVATLAAALGLALGLSARYVAVSFGPSHVPEHVYAELENAAPPPPWVDMDILRPAGPLPESTSQIIVDV